MPKGFFSIIQFSPDPARNEAINIGILLAIPELNFLEVKITENLTRVKSVLVTKNGSDFIRTAISAFSDIVIRWKDKLLNTGELEKFIKTRAHEVRLTPLRNIKIENPGNDLEILFKQLVPVTEQKYKPTEKLPFPALDTLLRSPRFSEKMNYDVSLTLPITGKQFKAPYSYVNGRTNYIKPEIIKSFDTAEKLAAEGEILNHKLGCQLIVVPKILMDVKDASRNICELFEITNVQCYTEDNMDDLLSKIEKEAHV